MLEHGQHGHVVLILFSFARVREQRSVSIHNSKQMQTSFKLAMHNPQEYSYLSFQTTTITQIEVPYYFDRQVLLEDQVSLADKLTCDTMSSSRGMLLPEPVPNRRSAPSSIAKCSRYLTRLSRFNHMDFEFAAWQILYLFTSPQKV